MQSNNTKSHNWNPEGLVYKELYDLVLYLNSRAISPKQARVMSCVVLDYTAISRLTLLWLGQILILPCGQGYVTVITCLWGLYLIYKHDMPEGSRPKGRYCCYGYWIHLLLTYLNLLSITLNTLCRASQASLIVDLVAKHCLCTLQL